MPGVFEPGPRDVVPLPEAVRTWWAISLQSFGGPAGQIAVMQHHLVDRKRWLGQERFLHALNYCMLLPGPEAQQLAIYTGWLLNGGRGGLIAGTLFVLPGFVAMLALSSAYVAAGANPLMTGLFAGLAPAVIAIVVQALWRIGARTLHGSWRIGIAVAAFMALAVLGLHFPLVILCAGVVGWFVLRAGPDPSAESGALIGDNTMPQVRGSRSRTLGILATSAVLWLLPPLLVGLVMPQSATAQMGWFFSGTALITFGGAYAVLSYVAHQAVSVFGWIGQGEMIRGLALAETTPGPLIMVVQFVAFVGAFRHPAGLNPWLAAVIAALLVVWVTFVPCFALVFLGAPYVERLRHHRPLSGALQAITAAVVGVIADLAVMFAVHTLFARTRPGPIATDLPVWSSIDPFAVGLTGVAVVLLFWARWSPLRTMAVCALVGVCGVWLG